ncbi:MAG: alanine:cation symporter family protein [Rikenellaceae bacterium]|nr:alanine:cation symporter family protein [Rikenellaceae bacterium]
MEGIAAGIASFLWDWPMVVLLLGTHIYLTVRLRFPQRYIGRAIRLSVKKDKGSTGDISNFSALATSLAATIGTGNIVGVATAVSLGGPGAVFWCWITGVFGIATKYGESLLAVKYRVKSPDGEIIGGPMYVLERGLKMRWLGVLFAVFTAFAAFGIGNTVQSNSISMLLGQTWGIPRYVTGGIVAGLVAGVILFGLKGISRVCSLLVPFMAVFYVLGCITILIMNSAFIGETFSLILRSAFSSRAAGGGFVGSTIMMAARYGIARGLFSNESGMGSAPIVAAAAQTRNPVRQALVSASGTFWDTVVICALTGLVLVSSIIANPAIDHTHGAALTKAAFDQIPVAGPIILSVGILTFAFSTILGWSYYAEKSIQYLGGKRSIYFYRIFWVAAIFFGAVVNLKMVWDIADSMNALMAIPNLVALIFLSGVLVRETRKYLWSGNLDAAQTDEIPTIDKKR